MRIVVKARSFLRNLFHSRRVEEDLDEEVQSHLEMLTAENIRAGMPIAEAQRAARIELGGIEQLKEQVREQHIGNWIHSVFADCRFAFRQLRKSPTFTIVAVLTLALGIGANTAVFSVAEAGWLRSWPGKDPERLAQIFAKTPQGKDDYFFYADYRELAEQSETLQGVLAYSRHAKSLQIGNDSKLLLDEVVSPNYFDVLGLSPEHGRTFSDEPRGSAERVVVISDALWRHTFGGDPGLIGKPIRFRDGSYTVIGIAPRDFRGIQRVVATDLWFPATTEYPRQDLAERRYRDFELLGRLRPGVSAAVARTELNNIGTHLAETYPAVDKAREIGMLAEPERLRQALVPASLLMAAVGLILLICCANVVGLILARSETRRQEIAVRMALGADRLRVVRQLLTEGAILAFAGSLLALVLARWVLSLQTALLPPSDVAMGFDLRLNVPVVAFAAVISAVAVLLIGLATVIQTSKPNLMPVLKGNLPGGSGARRFIARNAFVVGEIAISVVLLISCGLLVRSLLFSRNIHLGFDSQKNLVFFDLNYDSDRSSPFFDEITKRASGLSGVKRAAYARRVLLSDSGGGLEQRVSIPGVELPRGQRNIPVKFNAVSDGYFKTAGTRILTGRTFSAGDSALSTGVVIISETMVRQFWPGGDAIGHHILAEGKDREIVGIAEDAKINSIHEPPEPYMYLPFEQAPHSEATLIIEASDDNAPVIAVVRSEIRNVSPNVPVEVRTMRYLLQQVFWADQMAAGFVGVLAGLGAFLASVGLYGVIAFVVNQRRHEIGIRMALGARRGNVVQMVLRQGLKLAALGSIIGLFASLGAMRLLSSLLYGVKPTDPLSLAAGTVVIIVVAVVASYFPARQATRVDPMIALRYE
jgi:macrolide transport system ATP-binding/permease protein